MGESMKIAAVALGALALAAATPASAQGVVNVYCSVQVEWCTLIANEFQKATGVKVSITQKGSGETIAQLKAEAQNPKGDVWFGGTGDPHLQAAEENLTEAYKSPKIAELHPWFSEDIFGKANMPLDMQTVYFGFLKKGPNRKDGDDKLPEVQELQKAHLANINRLAETKKLVLAGPFGDDGELRGVFVFRVESLKEAEGLASTDPMIKIDRLKIELHPWQVPSGVIP
jgi:uncharacterized protein YciI